MNSGQIRRRGLGLKSVSNDFRILGVDLLQPEQVRALTPRASRRIVAITVGYGIELPQRSLEIEGRLVLNNGSHRAYALRQAGTDGHGALPRSERLTARGVRVLVGASHPLITHSEAFLRRGGRRCSRTTSTSGCG